MYRRRKIERGLANTDSSPVRRSSRAWIGASRIRISSSGTASAEPVEPAIQPWNRYTPTTSAAPSATIVPQTIVIVPSSRS